MRNRTKRITLLSAAALGSAAILLLAGCSTPKSNNTAASASPGAAAAADLATFTTNAKALVDKVSSKQTQTPPTDGPKAVAGSKKIFIIACSMAAEGCSRPANAVAAAAKAIGWESTINDPGGDPSKMANAVSQAVSSGYNAIVVTAIDAQSIQQPLQQAKGAGLLTGAIASVDVASKPLFDTIVPGERDFYDQGYAQAAKIFVNSGPDMKIAMLTGTEFGTVRKRVDGTKRFVADCVAAGGGCSIVDEQNFLVTGLTTSLPGQAAALVRAHSGLSALWVGYDAGANFAIEGLKSASLTVPVYSFDGNVANLARVSQGDMEVADAATAMQWSGYGVIDNFNRIWSSQKVIDEGPSFKLLTKDNVTSGKAWDGDMDVANSYKKIWGAN